MVTYISAFEPPADTRGMESLASTMYRPCDKHASHTQEGKNNTSKLQAYSLSATRQVESTKANARDMEHMCITTSNTTFHNPVSQENH